VKKEVVGEMPVKQQIICIFCATKKWSNQFIGGIQKKNNN
jgi:hypothetical protein